MRISYFVLVRADFEKWPIWKSVRQFIKGEILAKQFTTSRLLDGSVPLHLPGFGTMVKRWIPAAMRQCLPLSRFGWTEKATRIIIHIYSVYNLTNFIRRAIFLFANLWHKRTSFPRLCLGFPSRILSKFHVCFKALFDVQLFSPYKLFIS